MRHRAVIMRSRPSGGALLWCILVPRLAALITILSSRVADAAPPIAALPFERTVLPNGLEVILHEDHRTPRVAVNVWYRVGFADDPPGKRGLAHLFEHLMLRGSKHVGRDKFWSTLEAVGASDRNATTSFDRTNYFETVPGNQLALALWVESDRMGFFLDMLDDATLEREKEVVRAEYRSGTLDAPYAFVQRFARNAVYPVGHPYHWKVEGEIDETAAITLEDLRAFFRTYYAPSNASLVIAGDIDPVTAKELVKKYFATLPSGAPIERKPPPATLRAEVRLEVEVGAEQPRLMIFWAGPAAYSEPDTALELVSDVLARSKGGRLYDALVRGPALADAVDAGSDVLGERLARIYWVLVTLKKGIDPERALEAVDRVLDDLRVSGPAPDELARARVRRADSLLWSLERTTRRADLLNAGSWLSGNPGALVETQRSAESSTPGSLRDTVVRWLPKDRRAVVFVRHAAGAPVSGRLVQGGKP